MCLLCVSWDLLLPLSPSWQHLAQIDCWKRERALQGNEHGTDQQDKKVLITQRSAENGIWASHVPSSSVTPGQMLTLWPFVILQNQPRVSHKHKIWVSYVPWEIKQQKKPQHVLLISYKLVYSSEQKSKDQKLSPTSGTYHSFELNANACEESTLSTYESSCPSQLNVLRHLLGKSINAQWLSQLHILFFCKHDLMWPSHRDAEKKKTKMKDV